LFVDLHQLDHRTAPSVIASRACDDRVSFPQSVLTDEIRSDVRVSWVSEVAIRGAANESAVARRVEPPHRLAVSDNRSRRLLLRSLPLTPAAAIAAIAAAVAVELLVLWSVSTRAVFAALVAVISVIAVVPVMAWLAMIPMLTRALVLAELARWALGLLRLARFRRGLAA
jgi:hypothetical protein